MRRFEVCSRPRGGVSGSPRAAHGRSRRGPASATPRGAVSARGRLTRARARSRGHRPGAVPRGDGRPGGRAGGARVSIRLVGPRPGLHALALGRRAGARGGRGRRSWRSERARRDALARRLALGILALAVALAAFAIPWRMQAEARRVPPIHDVTTDPEDPPVFVAVVARRAGARNPVEYAGPAVAAQQRAAYPDLVPLDLAAPPERVFPAVEAAARESRLGDRGGGAGGGPARGDGHDVLVRLQGRRRRASAGARNRQPGRRPVALADRRRRPRRQRRPRPRVPRTDAGDQPSRGVTPRGGVS